MTRLAFTLLITLGALATVKPAAAQTTYTVTDLGLIAGALTSRARALNDNGWVVGDTTITNNRITRGYRGWLWKPAASNGSSGSLTTLNPLSGDYSAAFDINQDGLIVGESGGSATLWSSTGYMPVNVNLLTRDASVAGWTFSSAVHVSNPVVVLDQAGTASQEISVAGYGQKGAFQGGIVWRIRGAAVTNDFTTGTIVSVTVPAGYQGIADWGDMNNRGQVTDYVTSGKLRACLWDGLADSAALLLPTPSTADSFGNGLNDYGTVVGQMGPVSATRGFVWTPSVPNGMTGSLVALDTLGGGRSFANAINDQNQIAGSAYLKGDKTLHACLWQNGAIKPTDLNTLKGAGATGLELLEARRINHNGSIIGRYSTSKGERAYLLSPK